MTDPLLKQKASTSQAACLTSAGRLLKPRPIPSHPVPEVRSDAYASGAAAPFSKAEARDAWVDASPRHDYHEGAIAARRAFTHQAHGIDPELLLEAMRQFAGRGWNARAFTEQAARNHVARLREERREAQRQEERGPATRQAGLRMLSPIVDALMRGLEKENIK